MRELTLTRQKAFAACLAKYKVYIQDDLNGDTVINGVNCRLLGKIKNGETAHFQIDEWESRLFVVAGGKRAREYCNDSVLIPAGSDPVSYSGRGDYAPQLGNPFRFDGNPDAFAEANRKKKSGKRWVIFVSIIVISMIVGVIMGLIRSGAFSKVKEKTFRFGEMEITLDETFHEQEVLGFKGVAASPKAVLYYLTEDYSGSLEEYTDLFRQTNIRDITNLQMTDKLASYEYTAEPQGTLYHYFVRILPDPKGGAYHVFQIAIFETDLEETRDKIDKWMDSVKIGA